jgi:hypothetical protein
MQTARALIIVTAFGLLALSACRKEAETRPVSPEAAKIQARAKASTGLPMRLVLPEHAHSEDELDLLPPRMEPSSTNWNTTFTYVDGFETIVADFDAQLKKQNFSHLSGPIHDVDPGFTMADTIKPLNARGKKVWISDDRTIVAFLSYQFQRSEKGSAEVNNYQLNVIRFDEPQEIKAPNKVVAIP